MATGWDIARTHSAVETACACFPKALSLHLPFYDETASRVTYLEARYDHAGPTLDPRDHINLLAHGVDGVLRHD